MGTADALNPATSKVPMLVIGAGMASTGTLSLKTALEILYCQPCYHISELLEKHRDHIAEWASIFQRKSCRKGPKFSELENIFNGYGAVTDLPGCAIYDDLMKAYPNAKVILTIRDEEKWIKSVRSTVIPKRRILDGQLFGNVVESICRGKGFYAMLDLACYAALGWDVDLSDEGKMKEAFNARNEKVKQTVPADRLLVFEVKEGWKPLCEFLGLPIPDQPFPNLNDTDSMQKHYSEIYITLRAVQVGAIFASVAALTFAAYKTGHFLFNPLGLCQRSPSGC